MFLCWGVVIVVLIVYINVDEGGVLEKIGGFKFFIVFIDDGKFILEFIDCEVWGWGDEYWV